MERLRDLDAFTKIDPTHCKPSFVGAVTTIILYCLIGLLTLYQVYIFSTTTSETYRNVVDPTTVATVPLHIDIVVASQCSRLRVQLTEKGNAARDISNLLDMQDIRPPTQQPTNNGIQTTQDWLGAFIENLLRLQQSEGSCRIRGVLDINKHSGTFAIASTRYYINLPMGTVALSDPSVNLSHKVHTFSFGPRLPTSKHVNNGMERGIEIIVSELHSFNYQVAVVPVHYHSADVDTVSYQHSVSQFAKSTVDTLSNPGIVVRYEFDPMSLDIAIARPPLRTLITKFLGIVGGIFMLSKIIYMAVDFVLTRTFSIENGADIEPLLESSKEHE